jgi:hypothetical protein
VSEGRRAPIVVVLAIAALIALVLGDVAATSVPRARDEGRAPAAALAPEGVRSQVWYCAFATADPLPHSDDAAILTNLSGRSVGASVSAMRDGQVTSVRQVELAPHATIALQAGDIGAAAGAGVLIEPFGSDVVVDHRASDTSGAVSQTPCATRPSSDWYVPAGSTRRDSVERVALFNPFTQAAVVDVTAFEPGGATRPAPLQGLSVAPRSRLVINVNRAADQRAALGLAVHAERGTRIVAEVALERRDAHGDGGFTIALGSPALAREWHVAADGQASATPTIAVLNPTGNDATVSVQTVVAGLGRATESFTRVQAGTLAVVGVPIPSGRPQLTVIVSSRTPSIAVAGFVSYKTRRGRNGAISIVTGATLDARRSAFATPGPGTPRTVTLVMENASAVDANVDISLGDQAHLHETVARSNVAAISLGVTAESAPLVITSNTPVYVFRRLDDGISVSTAPGLPAT